MSVKCIVCCLMYGVKSDTKLAQPSQDRGPNAQIMIYRKTA